MLLTILTLSCFALGSSINDHDYTEYDHKRCYGRDFRFPFEYTPPGFRGQIYFTPSKTGGSRKLVMENGEAKDPRLKVSLNSVTLEHLTERDEGTFSISVDGNRLHDVIELEITECAEQVVRSYNGRYSYNVPREAEFLEFTPIFRLDQSRVLWNRTDPQTNTGGRGHVKRNVWEISELTQADNGFYNFRKKDKTLKSRIKLIVQEHKTYYDAKVNEELHITYPVAFTPWNMAFTPKGEKKSIMLMRAGNMVEEDDSMSESLNLIGRLQEVNEGIEIYPVESTDSGAFEFRDQEGNLVLVVQVKVEDGFPPAYVYALIAFGIILAKDPRLRVSRTEAEFLEFTPIFRLDQSRVLWNRTDPQTNTGGRGHVKRNVWEISKLTQADNGFYNFRKKDKTLKSRIRLIVQEHKTYYDAKVNEDLYITYPVAFTPWHMAFTPKGRKKSIMLMRAGNLVEEDDSMSESLNLIGRLQEVYEGIEISPVESTDSGAFEFRDQEGNLVLVVQVKVEDGSPLLKLQRHLLHITMVEINLKAQVTLLHHLLQLTLISLIMLWALKNLLENQLPPLGPRLQFQEGREQLQLSHWAPIVSPQTLDQRLS
eukprot:superscaffoldBa00005948_g20967